ncbi:MAG: hypothetical protein ABR906_10735 [Terracidiphilus sp.]|jgi:hypothetical protein
MQSSKLRLLSSSLFGVLLGFAVFSLSVAAQTTAQAKSENSGASAFTTVDVTGAGTGTLQGTYVVGIDTAGDMAGSYINSLDCYSPIFGRPFRPFWLPFAGEFRRSLVHLWLDRGVRLL